MGHHTNFFVGCGPDAEWIGYTKDSSALHTFDAQDLRRGDRRHRTGRGPTDPTDGWEHIAKIRRARSESRFRTLVAEWVGAFEGYGIDVKSAILLGPHVHRHEVRLPMPALAADNSYWFCNGAVRYVEGSFSRYFTGLYTPDHDSSKWQPVDWKPPTESTVLAQIRASRKVFDKDVVAGVKAALQQIPPFSQWQSIDIKETESSWMPDGRAFSTPLMHPNGPKALQFHYETTPGQDVLVEVFGVDREYDEALHLDETYGTPEQVISDMQARGTWTPGGDSPWDAKDLAQSRGRRNQSRCGGRRNASGRCVPLFIRRE